MVVCPSNIKSTKLSWNERTTFAMILSANLLGLRFLGVGELTVSSSRCSTGSSIGIFVVPPKHFLSKKTKKIPIPASIEVTKAMNIKSSASNIFIGCADRQRLTLEA